jgi:hypothetical protein
VVAESSARAESIHAHENINTMPKRNDPDTRRMNSLRVRCSSASRESRAKKTHTLAYQKVGLQELRA